MGEGTFTIKNYLDQYAEKAKDLLNLKLNEEYGQYTETVFTTWAVTIDKINEEICGEEALKILDVIAYLAPEKIPIKVYSKLIGDAKRDAKLRRAVELLDQYSMANRDSGVLNVHRLVQQVTRINLKEQNKEKEIVGEAFKLLKENFPYGSDKLEDYARKKQLLPHSEAFLSHMNDWLTKNLKINKK